MKPANSSVSNSIGFTLLEVIAVLLLISIVSAVAISKTASTESEQALSEVHQVKAHLRYAQSRAMADNAAWGIYYASSNTYWLFETTGGNRKLLPGQTADTVTLAYLTITGTPQTITFDGYGSPGANTLVIHTSSTNITVTANTGYIP
ncbi:MAG: type II secretion system protein [Desulfobacteraceae bacterium]|nr:MAG: type II secretion system protein [Desulfobacteraceae bacterium]